MQASDDVPIAPHTSMRVGGTAATLLEPETEEELVEAFRRARGEGRRVCVLGRGSNTIFRDGRFDGVVIKTGNACRRMEVAGSRRRWLRRWTEVYAGAGVPLQAFIRFCAGRNLEAPAYLYSVPGNIGGAVVMNAGTGVREARCISERLARVRVCDGRDVRELARDECGFEFRGSRFHREEWIVLGAAFDVPRAREAATLDAVKARMEFVARTQDTAHPNAGSVFKTGFRNLPGIQGLRIGNAMFSQKTPNWIVNLGGAAAADVLQLIERAVQIHREHGLPDPVLELHVK